MAPKGLIEIPGTTTLDPPVLYHFPVQPLFQQFFIIIDKQVNKNTTNLPVNKREMCLFR